MTFLCCSGHLFEYDPCSTLMGLFFCITKVIYIHAKMLSMRESMHIVGHIHAKFA